MEEYLRTRLQHPTTRYYLTHGPLTRYVQLRVAHAPGMSGTFPPSPRVSDPDIHHGTCVTHVQWCMLGLLTSGFLWNRWLGKRSRYFRCMRYPQFYVSGKRPMETCVSSLLPSLAPNSIIATFPINGLPDCRTNHLHFLGPFSVHDREKCQLIR